MDKNIGYQYDSITNAFICEIPLQIDPLERKIIMPQYCTTLKPIQCNENEIAIYNKSRKKWDKIIDYRGIWYDKHTGTENKLETIYDTSLSTQTTLREELEKKQQYNYKFGILKLLNGTELVKENPSNTDIPFEMLEWNFYDKRFDFKKDMVNIKKSLISKYKDEFTKRQSENIVYNDIFLQTDDNTKMNLQLKILSMNDNDTTQWLDAENNFVEFTKKHLCEILKMIEVRNQLLFVVFQNIKNDIMNCKDYEELSLLIPNWKESIKLKKIEPEVESLFEKYLNEE